MKVCPSPASYGQNLKEQAGTGARLRYNHGNPVFELVSDRPAFDTGKKMSDLTFVNGVRAWELRTAFMILGSWFTRSDINAYISLAFAMAHVVFQKGDLRQSDLVFHREIFFWDVLCLPD